MQGLALELEGLDAIDGTPVVDIKPYMTAFAPRGEVREPAWATELMSELLGVVRTPALPLSTGDAVPYRFQPEDSMERRKFLASSLAASAMAAVASSEYLQAAPSTGREFYQLRLYRFINGPQRKAADAYFRDALIPALNRLGITPVGVLNLTIGPQTPTVYVLMPSTSLETLITVEDRLAQDTEYMKAGCGFSEYAGGEAALRPHRQLAIAGI